MSFKGDKSLQKKCIRSFKEYSKKFDYKPFDRQKEFHDSDAKYRLFGGAAGPLKTKALLYEAIICIPVWTRCSCAAHFRSSRPR